MESEKWLRLDWVPVEVSSAGGIKIRGRLRIGSLYNNGYRYIRITVDGKPHCLGVHRLVCEAFHGKPPTPKHDCAHNNGIRDDNRASNLRWATRKENLGDTEKHGTRMYGSKNHRTKLAQQSVVAMRKEYAAGGIPLRVIAEKYGVDPAHVWGIVNRRCWKHVP